MKNLFFLVFLFSTVTYSQKSKNNSIEPFLPEIIAEFPNVRDISISSNGREAYFSVQSYMGDLSAIVMINKEADDWSKPEVASFSGKFHDIEPFLSPDGLKLYYASKRPINASEVTSKDFDIWVVERTDMNSKWSQPINLGAPINTSGNEFYPAITTNGNLYFTSDGPLSLGKDDIFFSKYENGKYTAPLSLESSINSEGYEFNAFVAPDETFLIFTAYNRKDGLGNGDLYISYKNNEGHWGIAKNLGDTINSNKLDFCPFVDPATNTLYFTSKRNIIKKSFTTQQSVKTLLDEMNIYQNGLSRLYKIPFYKL
jgi:hypothetical protein